MENYSKAATTRFLRPTSTIMSSLYSQAEDDEQMSMPSQSPTPSRAGSPTPAPSGKDASSQAHYSTSLVSSGAVTWTHRGADLVQRKYKARLTMQRKSHRELPRLCCPALSAH